jgi:hypothetical protein
VGNFLSNTLEYKEKLMHTQYGFKISFLIYLDYVGKTLISMSTYWVHKNLTTKNIINFSQVLLQLMKFQIKVVYP